MSRIYEQEGAREGVLGAFEARRAVTGCAGV